MRARLAPIWVSISGILVSSVWPSYGLPGSVLTWAMNWSPFERASVVATDTLTPNSWGRCALPSALGLDLSVHFDLGRVQRIDLPAAFILALVARPDGQRQRLGQELLQARIIFGFAHDVAQHPACGASQVVLG